MSETNIQSVLSQMFYSALDQLANKEDKRISDLFIQVDAETGEVLLFDDEETLLDKNIVFDWVNSKEPEEEFRKKITPILQATLTLLSSKNVFDSICFNRPFSVSLTDEDFVVLEELLFLDDDTLRLDDPFLKDLDEDLNNFLAQLLSDVK